MENMKDMKKLNLEEMDKISGGTYKECGELFDAFMSSSHTGSKVGAIIQRICDDIHTLGLAEAFSSGNMEGLLNEIGIEADCSKGFLGIGSKNNTYRDKATGTMLLHGEVLEYIKTGKKTW